MSETQRNCRRQPWVLGPALLVLLAAATAVHADWLVTRDGGRIETQGAWTERGDLVVFTLPNGALGSLQKAQLDLDASRRVTAAAAERAARPQQSEAAPKRKAVLVLTDADVAHVSRSEPAAPAAGAEASGGPQKAAAGVEPVEVISWQESELPDGAGLFLTGTVRNTGDAVAAGLSMSAILYDPDGKVLATAPAKLGAGALGPGQSATFRADFPSLFSFSGVSFSFSYQPLRTSTEPPEAEATPRREPQ